MKPSLIHIQNAFSKLTSKDRYILLPIFVPLPLGLLCLKLLSLFVLENQKDIILNDYLYNLIIFSTITALFFSLCLAFKSKRPFFKILGSFLCGTSFLLIILFVVNAIYILPFNGSQTFPSPDQKSIAVLNCYGGTWGMKNYELRVERPWEIPRTLYFDDSEIEEITVYWNDNQNLKVKTSRRAGTVETYNLNINKPGKTI